MTRDLTRAYVHCPTQEDYDRYMKFLEENTDWTRLTGCKPKKNNYWWFYSENTIIKFQNEFVTSNVLYTDLVWPCLSVDEAIEELKKGFSIDDTPMFKEWERVLVRNNCFEIWEERIYLITLPWNAKRKYICVDKFSIKDYENWKSFSTAKWWRIKPLPKTLDGEIREIEGKKYKLTLVS